MNCQIREAVCRPERSCFAETEIRCGRASRIQLTVRCGRKLLTTSHRVDASAERNSLKLGRAGSCAAADVERDPVHAIRHGECRKRSPCSLAGDCPVHRDCVREVVWVEHPADAFGQHLQIKLAEFRLGRFAGVLTRR